MPDFFGHSGAVDLSYRPHNGEWMLIDLDDPAKKVALVEHGAHASRDGSLVSIFRAQGHDASTSVTKSDGSAEVHEGAVHPAMFVLVDRDGNNVPVATKGPGGHMAIVDVCFHADSPSLRNVRPLRDTADMPPGRVVHPDWTPGMTSTEP